MRRKRENKVIRITKGENNDNKRKKQKITRNEVENK